MNFRFSRMFDWRHKIRLQSTIVLFLVILVLAALTTKWIDNSMTLGTLPERIQQSQAFKTFITKPECFAECSKDIPLVQNAMSSKTGGRCPGYFRWIYEDLKPWKESGISEEMIERAKGFAHFRLVVVSGRVYVEKYKKGYQTRDAVTIWGILQLLRMYPGKLPDLDLMFECDDKPVIRKRDYGGSNATLIPPPLFHFCGDDSTFDIVFPDWSFWGWPELSIKPWEMLKKDIEQGNDKLKWLDREPYAFWKGNAELGATRSNLVKCNDSKNQQWNAQIYNVNWGRERKDRFQTANLSSQCTHRYKIYVEGRAWSVSQKYILACDSVSLFISPQYYDFFTRTLLPTVHYWPINAYNICNSIKFAVDWGNKHTKEAQEIGKTGSKYVKDELKMKYVYGYMFHLLQEYGKLLKFRPVKPEGAVEICPEAMICSVKGMKKRFRLNSMVHSPAESGPCALQPPIGNEITTLQSFLDRKENLTRQVELLEAIGNLRKKSA